MKVFSAVNQRKTLKLLSVIVLVFAMTVCSAYTYREEVSAANQVGVTTAANPDALINVRESASTSSTSIAKLYVGTKVTVTGSTKGADGYTWYSIDYTKMNGVPISGYIRSDCLTVSDSGSGDSGNPSTPGANETSMSGTGRCIANNVYVRKAPGSSGEYILSLYNGDTCTFVGSVTVNGAIWYHITGSKNGVSYDGYSYGSYYVTVSDGAGAPVDNSDYAQTLKTAGFPDSYINQLVSLHAKYPNWIFQPVQTGLDWNTVITQESVNKRNVVSKDENDAAKSLNSGSYNWYTNTWTAVDNGSWVTASSSIISYYMDPRNFLDDTNIFQFEVLRYSSSQTLTGVKDVIGTSFMAKDAKESDGSTFNYANALMSIGKEINVSPYHLASRLKQEQGQGTSPLISGTYAGYEGYYNYFNFNASGDSKTAIYVNGLKYAKQQGWNTRYKSISGGASKLAANYINRGQDTLYFQKFNVVYTGGLYTHQYMQNLKAPYSEGRSMAKAYSDKSQAFVFRIPVYNNMPASACVYSASGNPNNYLKTLSVSGQSFTPGFDGATTSYSMVVANSVSSVNVSASAVASTSTVSGTGNYSLSTGNNVIQVKCKSQSGSVKTYTITIFRQAGAGGSNTNTNASVSSSTYTIDSYVSKVPVGTTANTLLSNVSLSGCTAKILSSNGAENTGTVGTGNMLALYENGTLVKTYEIVIYGDINGDGKISATDTVSLYRYMNGKKSLSNAYLKAADINRDGKCGAATDMVKLYLYMNGKATITQ